MISIRRLLLPVTIALVALTMPPIVRSQTVAVTGTITDTQTTPYSNGLLTVTFVNATGQLATFGGNPSFQKSYAIYLDANGSFTISLPPNSTASPSIQPAGTQWNFSYQSQGGYGAANVNVTITGAGSISGTLSNLARITWPYGNIPPPGAAGQGIVFVSSTTLGWGTTGTAGAVTHTAGNLTALHLMLGNGLADSTVDSACLTNGTGALSGCTSISAGSGASAAGATAAGGFACVEGASTGWTPTVGQDYQRCDSTLHNIVCSLNGAAETPCSSGVTTVFSRTGAVVAAANDYTLNQIGNPTAAVSFQPTVDAGVLFKQSNTANTVDIFHVQDKNGLELFRVDNGGILRLGTGGAATCTVSSSSLFCNTGSSVGAGTFITATNCSSSASPAVCGSAAAGSVAVPTGVTPTLVVNTTAVTANSQILFTPDESLGTKLGVTCNSTIAQVAIEPIVTARTAATSFTIQYNTTITVNPICLSYWIVN